MHGVLRTAQLVGKARSENSRASAQGLLWGPLRPTQGLVQTLNHGLPRRAAWDGISYSGDLQGEGRGFLTGDSTELWVYHGTGGGVRDQAFLPSGPQKSNLLHDTGKITDPL